METNKDNRKPSWQHVVMFSSLVLGIGYGFGNYKRVKQEFKADFDKNCTQVTRPVYDTTYLEHDTMRIDSSELDTFYLVPKHKLN